MDGGRVDVGTGRRGDIPTEKCFSARHEHTEPSGVAKVTDSNSSFGLQRESCNYQYDTGTIHCGDLLFVIIHGGISMSVQSSRTH